MQPVFDLSETGGSERLGTGSEPDSVTPEERAIDLAIIRDGLAYCASLGISSTHNMDGNLYQLEILDEIEKTTGLPARVRIPYHMKNFMPLSDLAEKATICRDRFQSDGFRRDERQPTHPPGNAGLPLESYLSFIGRDRWPLAFAWRTLADAGAEIVFATDWPVSPLDPMGCIHDAMTRQRWADDLPDQRLTLAETLAAYTSTSARVEFMEDRKGMLKPVISPMS